MQTTTRAAATESDRYRAHLLTACKAAVGHLERCAAGLYDAIGRVESGQDSIDELPGDLVRLLASGTANAAAELSRAPAWLAKMARATAANR